ncbi:MAG: 5'-methylthioadenosine/adenosylhomocysteine nucleosidase [Erysipelotrichaceae bacterium]|nr:5'-methylthioadenosine/adenosylhomocysteine nucleosidase [Erysipelotrichaceae bacterium]
MIGIIAAMEEERNSILKRMKDVREEKRNGFLFHHGTLKGKETVLAKCGIGKTNAAIITTVMILRYHPSLLINTGCAGSLNKDVHVGDIVVSDKAADWDIDVPVPEWTRGFDCERMTFPVDPELLKKVKKIKCDVPVSIGGIVSGESFIYKKSQVNTILKYYPEALCGEMEGSSVARTASRFDTPFLIIRSISDATLVQGDFKNFDFNLELACENSAVLTEKIVRICG